MKISLGEKEVDLALAIPVTLGDIRVLKKDHGVKMTQLSEMDADIVAMVVLVLAQKVDKTITEEDINKLPLTKIAEVAMFLQTKAYTGDDDHPT